MAAEKMRERTRNRYKACREKIDVTEESFVRRYISMYSYVLTNGHIIIINKRC